jgi:hypothetical protein
MVKYVQIPPPPWDAVAGSCHVPAPVCAPIGMVEKFHAGVPSFTLNARNVPRMPTSPPASGMTPLLFAPAAMSAGLYW